MQKMKCTEKIFFKDSALHTETQIQKISVELFGAVYVVLGFTGWIKSSTGTPACAVFSKVRAAESL